MSRQRRLTVAADRGRELLPELGLCNPEFTVDQLVLLAFASEAELTACARKIPDDWLTDRKVVKGLIERCQADFLHA